MELHGLDFVRQRRFYINCAFMSFLVQFEISEDSFVSTQRWLLLLNNI